jgi:nicotinamide mononucleotide adenylyltransferase
MTDVGVIHGRFQVLHNDHLRYIMAGKSKCRHIVVGITNPDPMLTRADPADPQRSSPGANPLTYFERYTMVRAVLVEEGLSYEDFSIVPFPVNCPELYRYYVPMEGVFYLTIYDRWGQRKLEQFKSAGLRTEVLWSRPREDKGLTGTDVRERMALGEEWKHMVPPATAALVNKWEIPERLCRLYAAGQPMERSAGSKIFVRGSLSAG